MGSGDLKSNRALQRIPAPISGGKYTGDTEDGEVCDYRLEFSAARGGGRPGRSIPQRTEKRNEVCALIRIGDTHESLGGAGQKAVRVGQVGIQMRHMSMRD